MMKRHTRWELSLADVLLLVALFPVLFVFWDEVLDAQLGREWGVIPIISPDDRQLARSSNQGFLVYDLKRRETTRRLPSQATRIVFSPDSTKLAFVYEDTTGGTSRVRTTIWNLADGGAEWQIPKEPHESAGPLTFSPDGGTLAVEVYEGVELWRLQTHERTAVLSDAMGQWFQFSPDGRRLFVGALSPVQEWDSGRVFTVARHSVSVWDTDTGERLSEVRGPGDLRCMGISDRGAPFVCAVLEREIHWYEPSTLRVSKTVPLERTEDPYGVYFEPTLSPDARNLACVCLVAEEIRVWDTTTGRVLGSLPYGDSMNPVPHFCSDGETLMVSSSGRSLLVWNTRTGNLSRRTDVPVLEDTSHILLTLPAVFVWLGLWVLAGRQRRADPAQQDWSRYLVVLAVVYVVGIGLVCGVTYSQNIGQAWLDRAFFLFTVILLGAIISLPFSKRLRRNPLFVALSVVLMVCADGFLCMMWMFRYFYVGG